MGLRAVLVIIVASARAILECEESSPISWRWTPQEVDPKSEGQVRGAVDWRERILREARKSVERVSHRRTTDEARELVRQMLGSELSLQQKRILVWRNRVFADTAALDDEQTMAAIRVACAARGKNLTNAVLFAENQFPEIPDEWPTLVSTKLGGYGDGKGLLFPTFDTNTKMTPELKKERTLMFSRRGYCNSSHSDYVKSFSERITSLAEPLGAFSLSEPRKLASRGVAASPATAFSMGGAVLLWDSPAVQWYYPALRQGVSHVAVNATTAARAIHSLGAHHNRTYQTLRDVAARVSRRLLCETCLGEYVAGLVRAVSDHFSFHAAVDDYFRSSHPAHLFFRRHVCGPGLTRSHLLEFALLSSSPPSSSSSSHQSLPSGSVFAKRNFSPDECANVADIPFDPARFVALTDSPSSAAEIGVFATTRP